VESWSEHVLMKIGGKPSGPPLDLALSLRIECLTNTDENMTWFKHVLETGGVEATGICRLSAVNIDVKIVCSKCLDIDTSSDLNGLMRLLVVNLRLA